MWKQHTVAHNFHVHVYTYMYIHVYVCCFFSLNSVDSEQPRSLTQDTHMSPEKGEEVQMSKNALTHTFKGLRTPSRCRECDNFVYFNGYECETVAMINMCVYA